jgi:protease IV
VQEIIAHIEFFRKSGKPTVAYVERGAEMEYMLASACEEVYVPPMGLLLLFGYCVRSVHVRGALDKLGMEPTVRCMLLLLYRSHIDVGDAIVWTGTC